MWSRYTTQCLYHNNILCRLYSLKLSSNKSIWPMLLVLIRRLHLMMDHSTLSTTWLQRPSTANQRRYIHNYLHSYVYSSSCCNMHIYNTLNDSMMMEWLDLPCVQVYKERVLTVAMNCAQQAAKTGVKRFIHVSTAQVYNSDKVNI